jgi:hypothetical protein
MKPSKCRLGSIHVLFLLALQHYGAKRCIAFVKMVPTSRSWQIPNNNNHNVRLYESMISSERAQSSDEWVAQAFEPATIASIHPEVGAIVGPERCLIYDTTLRGEKLRYLLLFYELLGSLLNLLILIGTDL